MSLLSTACTTMLRLDVPDAEEMARSFVVEAGGVQFRSGPLE